MGDTRTLRISEINRKAVTESEMNAEQRNGGVAPEEEGSRRECKFLNALGAY